MESEFVNWLRTRLPSHPQLRLGAGDDAALVRSDSGLDCVMSSDMLMDEVDFRLTECDPRRVGRKALAVNLSDLAAMAAEPVTALVSLALPQQNAGELAVELYEGMLPLAKEFDCPISGGDTNCWDGPLAISVTVLGRAAYGTWRRDQAQVGDDLLATGEFGGSLLGHHFDFLPRLREAGYLARRFEVHAAMDVSDGLTLDLHRMASASGLGAELELARIPIAEDARRMAEQDGRTPLEHALSDGEDFELLLAMPPAESGRLLASKALTTRFTRIGRFVESPGLWQLDEDGRRSPLEPRGYLHGGA